MLESSLGAPSSAQKHAKVCYHFVARNTNELSVIQGDILEVLEDEKQWWRLRSRSGQEGYVPCNILKLVDQPPPRKPAGLLITQPPQAPKVPPAPAPVSVPVSVPVSAPVRVPLRTAESRGERVERSKSPQDKDSRTQVNDELLQRITASKSQPPARNFRVERPAGNPVPLTYESQPWEVSAWLNAKGFSKMTVNCLGILTGAQLFSLNKEELKAVCGDEGARVYSQVTVQKTQLERFEGTSELQEIMRRRQEEVDAFAYD